MAKEDALPFVVGAEAQGGLEFVPMIKELNLESLQVRGLSGHFEVLSGEAEAHFAALGVVAGIPDFTGIVGDLGGGSLELSSITSGLDAVGETHELGVDPDPGATAQDPLQVDGRGGVTPDDDNGKPGRSAMGCGETRDILRDGGADLIGDRGALEETCPSRPHRSGARRHGRVVP